MLHNKCQTPVYTKNNSMIVLSTFGISDSGIRNSIAEILPSANTDGPQFYCMQCAKEVPVSEIIYPCSHCGTIHSVSDLHKIENVGGVYCSNCKTELFSTERSTAVSVLLTKISRERLGG